MNRKSNEEMLGDIAHQVSITFSDVAAYFYEEEWELLEAWQKQLYRNVMKEIHKALISMGYTIANTDVLFRIKNEEESYFTSHQNAEKRRRLLSVKSSSQNIKPEILLRVKQAGQFYIKDHPRLEGRKAQTAPTPSDPVFNPDMSIWIKQVEEPYSSGSRTEEKRHANAHIVARPLAKPEPVFCIKSEKMPQRITHTLEGRQRLNHEPLTIRKDANPVPSVFIKQEDGSSPMKYQVPRRVEMVNRPLVVPGTQVLPRLGTERPLGEEKEGKNTQILIKTSVTIFKYYLRARRLDLRQVEQYNKNQLNRLLCMFYAGMRKPNGDYYAKKSIISFRYGLQRHFAQLKGIDIMHDPAFRDANSTLAAMLARLKSEGRAEVQHKEPLTREDFKKLYDGCDINTPPGLQHKVFIDVMLHLCSRGREKLREFHKDEFQIAIDARGHKYVSAKKNPLSMNYRGELVDEDEGPRMYELKGNPRCPVLSFEKYMMKLHPGHSAFWQRPKMAAPSNSSPWYSNTPVGKNTLGNYMKNLSQDYGLSRMYTNHCLRVTCNMALVDLCVLRTGM